MALAHRDHQLFNLETFPGFLQITSSRVRSLRFHAQFTLLAIMLIFLRALSGISTGHLTIIDGEDVHELGADAEPRALLRIRSDEFWKRGRLVHIPWPCRVLHE